jgi:hypothetical protein
MQISKTAEQTNPTPWEDLQPPRRACGSCAWSWATGNKAELLCLNPESPHCYDVVPDRLACTEHSPECD